MEKRRQRIIYSQIPTRSICCSSFFKSGCNQIFKYSARPNGRVHTHTHKRKCSNKVVLLLNTVNVLVRLMLAFGNRTILEKQCSI